MSGKTTKISAIVLAAGLSTRMGEFKQLLPFKNKTVVSSVIEALLASTLSEIIVIVGYKSELVKKELGKYNVKIIYNPDYNLGMHTSVITGVENIHNNCEYFMIVLGDQPHISVKIIDCLIQSVQNVDKDIVIPSYNNKRGHPILINKKYIKEVLEIGPDMGLKKFILEHNQNIEYINIDEEGILDDMDTPEDYKNILNKYASNNNMK